MDGTQSFPEAPQPHTASQWDSFFSLSKSLVDDRLSRRRQVDARGARGFFGVHFSNLTTALTITPGIPCSRNVLALVAGFRYPPTRQRGSMVQRVSTVAFEGIEARAVDVQVQVAPGLPAFAIVGLPDKAVSEARERVRSALIASGLALPARRITVNLAPADLPKEGSHYDLPIALGLMAAIGAIPPDALSGFTVLGELGLDGSIAPVAGVLPAAIGANSRDEGLICPASCGAEAAWASPDIQIVAASSLIQIANHFKGTQVLSRPQPRIHEAETTQLDLRDIKGQESAKRALEIAAAGGHHLLMIGSPGAGKTMLAARLASILPPLVASALLGVFVIASVAVRIAGSFDDRLRRRRNPRRRADGAAAVPQPASFRQHGGAHRRRHARKTRRNLAGASGRAVPRRIAGVRSAGAGFAAAAAGERRGRGVARQPSRHLSRAPH